MKCEILFSGKKNVTSLMSAELTNRMVKVEHKVGPHYVRAEVS